MTTQQGTTSKWEQQDAIWRDMLSGKIKFEEGRALLLGLGYTAQQAQGIIDLAVARRQEGLNSGASWAYNKETPASFGETVAAQPAIPDQAEWETDNPEAAYMRTLGLPSVGANPFQRWLAGQFDPLFSAFTGQDVLKTPGGGSGSGLANYLAQGGRGMQIGNEAALNTIQSLGNTSAAGQGEWLENFRGVPGGNSGAGGNLSNFLQAALRGRNIAGPVARSFARAVPRYEEEWYNTTLGGTQPGSQSLIDYLRRRLGF